MPTYTGIIRGTVTDSLGQQAYDDLPVIIVIGEGSPEEPGGSPEEPGGSPEEPGGSPEEPGGSPPFDPICENINDIEQQSSFYYEPHPLDVTNTNSSDNYGGWATAMTPDGGIVFSGIGFGAAVNTPGITPGLNYDGAVAVLEWDEDTEQYVETTRFSHTIANDDINRTNNFGSIVESGGSSFAQYHTRIIATNNDGTFVAVGAPDYIEGGLQGAVFLFERTGDTYNQIGVIRLDDTWPSNGGVGFEGPPDSSINSRTGFGACVALRGDGGPGSFMFVSHPEARYDTGPWGDYVGLVYAFKNDEGTWVNSQVVNTTTPLETFPGGDAYGEGSVMALSRDGSTLVTGLWFLYRAPGDSTPEYKVYRWNNATEEMELYCVTENSIPVSTSTGGYGDIAISDDGTRFVATQPFIGRAEVWDDDGDGMFTQTTLHGGWSSSCAICGSGDVIATSSLYSTDNPDTGRVTIRKLYDNEWAIVRTIDDPIPPRPGSSYHFLFPSTYAFGWSMAMSQSGSRVFVTSPSWGDEQSDLSDAYHGAAASFVAEHGVFVPTVPPGPPPVDDIWSDDLVVSVGASTTTTPSPANVQWRRRVIVSTYSSAEIQAATGKTAATIVGLRFFVVQAPDFQPFPDYAIGMKLTSDAVGINASGGSFVVVKDPSSEAFTASSYKEFVFDTPFVWEAGTNLAISWAWGQAPGDNSTGTVNWTGTGDPGRMYHSFSDAAGAFTVNDFGSFTQLGRTVIQLKT